MKKLIPLILTALTVFAGCKCASKLQGNWLVTGLTKDGVPQTIVEAYIEFDGKSRVTGNSGVNIFNGSVKAVNGKFSAGNLALTKMMGDPQSQEFEDLFLEVLNNACEYRVDGNLLTISAPTKNLELQFRKQ